MTDSERKRWIEVHDPTLNPDGTLKFPKNRTWVKDSELLRDIGIYRASSHADKLNRNWTQDAYKALEAFSRTHWGAFTCEQVRAWAHWIPDPPDKRAWGKPFQMAVKKGLIECIGYQPHVSSS